MSADSILFRPLAILDLETTGAHPARDRITEIAVYLIDEGCLARRWVTLVNPGVPIPASIQSFTGITDDMVQSAPLFADLMVELRELLQDRILIAHNARFDHGFLCNEFLRHGQEFDIPLLCTVKLSRTVFPEHARHGLDALIERHGLPCSARHRAEGDTEALWAYLQLLQTTVPADVLERALQAAMKHPARPPGLPAGVLDGIPDTPGVYRFYGINDLPLYIGKSVSLRSRVLSHFAPGSKQAVDQRLAAEVRRVDWTETAGEIGALLLEADEVKRLKPLHNRQLRDNQEILGVSLRPPRRNHGAVERRKIAGTDPRDWGDMLAVYRGKRDLDNHLRELAHLYQLCLKRLGLESGQGACSGWQIKRCAGACVGREEGEVHDRRLLQALGTRRWLSWPHDGVLRWHEEHAASGRCEVHLFHVWCHLGSFPLAEAPTDDEALALPHRFDWDVWRLLVRRLGEVPAAAR